MNPSAPSSPPVSVSSFVAVTSASSHFRQISSRSRQCRKRSESLRWARLAALNFAMPSKTRRRHEGGFLDYWIVGFSQSSLSRLSAPVYALRFTFHGSRVPSPSLHHSITPLFHFPSCATHF